MQHYFTTRPQVVSRPREVRAHLRGRTWAFLTDRGVFGHRGVDAGTRLLIDTMVVRSKDHVLDLGCGYGAAGIVAATLASQGRVVMIDINERAVALAAENARRHGLTNVEALQGDGVEPLAGRRFHVIVTNPPIRAGRGVLRRLFRDAYEHLHPHGRFYFVARTAQGAKTLAREVSEIFGGVQEAAKAGGYRVYYAVKDGADAGG
jgi:16S rRNA (guanine1207-N2)-methyltransferase